MPEASHRDRLADWFREHVHVLDTLDPDAPLDDLDPLRDIVGDASVTARHTPARHRSTTPRPRN